MLLRPAMNDARTGWWEAFKFAAAVADCNRLTATSPSSSSSPSSQQQPAVVVDASSGGHFRAGGRRGRAEDVAKSLAFLLSALDAEQEHVPAADESSAQNGQHHQQAPAMHMVHCNNSNSWHGWGLH